MGQHAFSGSFDMSVQANYQALMGFISASLVADGWTLTADTGQTDPSGAALPATNTDTVHQLFVSPGALTPVYLRLSYQRDAGNHPQLAIQLGTGTNGTGTITGILATALTINTNSIPAAGHAYVSASDGWATIALDVNNGASGLVYLVDRSVDTTGVYTSDYVTQVAFAATGATGHQQTLMLAGGTQPPANVGCVGPFPRNSASWIIGTNLIVPFMLPLTSTGVARHSPNVAFWSNSAADFAAETITQVTIYGSAKSYLVCVSPYISGNTVFRGMVRYE